MMDNHSWEIQQAKAESRQLTRKSDIFYTFHMNFQGKQCLSHHLKPLFILKFDITHLSGMGLNNRKCWRLKFVTRSPLIVVPSYMLISTVPLWYTSAMLLSKRRIKINKGLRNKITQDELDQNLSKELTLD